ncbi:gamma-glutamyl-gamma-aminobutyraldehyde dehydrogenase [Roseiarcus fermentans]|uniref:Gamma-glutamyl-gamma-aminobutyraldehyde dehydrogenase n=1 Tax=Roseiarcus fermentans TaxID=1473586 RepID=A0A366FUH8_9HYPH|nr:aldehyde dehydrogenase [Roseiarcus fermentans]RBP18171.1 gamma-glutamyl-gamma-aminobutyraldehyde dehydrogenase [Roseiarcus fermentans]
MLDRPPTREGWIARAAALTIEGRAFIGGAYVDALDGATFARVSPIDGKVFAHVADCGEADVDRAVRAARAAFDSGVWRDADPQRKKAVLLRFASLIRENAEELALLETLDVGKVIANTLDVDVPFCANCIQYYGELADKLTDEIAPLGREDVAMVRREPLGVVGAIVPWNYPLIIAAWKIGPALVAGNSVVLKPAEQSPLASLVLGRLARQAGLPDGVLNIVPGFGEKAGKPLALHPDVDMIAFTGSTEVGKLMMVYAGSSNMKRVALECGGKSPHVVMADADLDAAAEAIAWGIYYNQGETCHAGSRVLAHASIRAALVEKIAAAQRAQIPLGHPFDREAQLGAMVDERQMQRVLGYIELGVKEGARIAHGGARALAETGGFYIEPTILDGAVNSMRIAQEEIFGPVVVIVPFETEAEAVGLANDTIYGLAAAVWTRDMNAAHRLTRAIRAGTVWVNTYDRSSLATPFGGFKQSGFGRDRSPHAIDKYMDFKTIWTSYR